MNCHDPNIAYDNFLSTYNKIYENCFPLKILTKNKAKLAAKPWITKGFLVSIKTKSKLYKEFLRSPTSANEYKYKKFKNKLNNLLKISKRSYYDLKFNLAKGNLRATWNLLNQFINRKSKKSKTPSTFIDNGNDINDPILIANRFCDFFTNISPSYAKKLPHPRASPETYLNQAIRESISQKPCNRN